MNRNEEEFNPRDNYEAQQLNEFYKMEKIRKINRNKQQYRKQKLQQQMRRKFNGNIEH